MIVIPSNFPIGSALAKIAAKDMFKSHKYRLVLEVLMWALLAWRSVPDFTFLINRSIVSYKNGQYLKLMKRLCMDYLSMGAKFFIRRALLVLIFCRWKDELKITYGSK